MSVRTVTVHLRAEVSAYLSRTKQAEKATKDLREEVERLDTTASLLTRGGLVAALAGVPGAIAPVAAGLAALPAFAITGAASFGVLAMATNGVGSAMKAVADGNSKKLAEAMAGLSTEAREFVFEYQRIKPTLDQLGDDVQDQFFGQMSGDLERLTAVYLPTMQRQLPALAGALGRMTSDLADFAAAPTTVAKVNRQIELATALTGDWSALLRSGIGLMLDLADASGDFTRGFVGGLAKGTEATRRWLATAKAQGQINDLFTNATRILDRLGDVAAETGDLLFDMAANPALADGTIALLDILHMMLEVVHGLVNAFGLLPGPLQSAVVMLLAVGGAAMLLAGRVAAMRAAMTMAVMKLDSFGPSGARAARGLEATSKWAARAAVALVAMHVAGAALSSFGDEATNVDKLTEALIKLGKTGESGGELDRIFGNRGGLFAGMTDDGPFEGLVRDLKLVDDGFSGIGRAGESLLPFLAPIQDALFGQSWSSASANIKALDQALTGMVENGRIREADIAFTRLLQQSGMGLHDLERLLPQYTAAMAEADKQTNQLSRTEEKAGKRAEILAAGLQGAVRQGKSLAKVFDELNGVALDWAEAQDNLESAIDDATEAIAENKRGLDAGTESGRENRRALREIAESTRDAAQARFAETHSWTDYLAVYERGRKAFVDVAMAAGETRQSAEALAEQWMKMPSVVPTTVVTHGVDEAIAKYRALKQALNGLPAQMAFGMAATSVMRWGGVVEHAQWGTLRDARVYSPRSPAHYATAEPATGGEAFVPKRGDYGRSMSILSTAAGWYGASVVAGGVGGGGLSAVIVQLIDPMTGAVMRQKQVDFAQARGVPRDAIRQAYP